MSINSTGRFASYTLLATVSMTALALAADQDSLLIKARVESVTAPGEAQPVLRWVVDLTSVQINIQDPDLKAALTQTIAEMTTENHPWVARGTQWNFFGQLSQRLSQRVSGSFSISPPSSVLKPATALGTEVIDRWAITYTPEVVNNLQIVIRSADAGKTPSTALKETRTLGDAAQGLSIGSLSDREKNIPVEIEYAQSDLAAAADSAPDAQKSALVNELLKLAGFAYKTAKKGGMGPGQKMPRNRGAIETQIQNNYSATKIDGWPNPKATIRQTSQGSGTWILTVENFQLISAARIKIEPIELQKELRDKGNTSDADRLEARRQEIESAYNRKYAARLLSQPSRVPTREAIDKDASLLAQVGEVESVSLASEGSALIFDITRRPQIATFSLKAGGGYSPEESFTGLVQLAASNLLHLNEVFSLGFTGGNQLLRGDMSFGLSWEEPKKKQFLAGFNLIGKFFRDRNQRLGNAQGPKLEDMESGGNATFSAGYDSFTPRDYILRAEGIDKNRKRLRYGVKLDAGFDYKDVSIQPDVASTPAIVEGQVAAFSLVVDQGLSLDLKNTPKSRFGEFNFFLKATARKAVEFLSADFPFEQFSVAIGSQLFFGPRAPDDMFVRFQSEIGVSSSGAPIFEQFRLGGPNNVRGLEEGEFIGRDLNFERAEIGVKSSYLLGLVRRKPLADAPSARPTVGGFDLSNTYLKAFYDWGRVVDKTSLADLFRLSSGVQGIGIGIELRGLNIGGKRASLTIGYAYSHDSLLHKSGVFVTGLSVDR